MKLARCSNNHYYDSDKYESCPHCGYASAAKEMSFKPVPQDKKEPDLCEDSGHSGKTIAKTSSMWTHKDEGSLEDATSVSPEIPSDTAVHEVDAYRAAEPCAGTAESESSLHKVESRGTLQAAVDLAKGATTTESSKTIAFYNIAESEPVVGWIVCVKGAYIGESFCLKVGRNTIGRSLNMDVALAREGTVSRDRHAIITYEPKKRKFYLQPGEGSGLSYLNEELLLTPSEMHDYDKLQFGNGEFIFRALCGETFTWEDYL